VIELSIDDLYQLSFADFNTKGNKQHLVNELLKQGSIFGKEEIKHLRYIPINTGEYILIQPLIIGFKTKTQEETPTAEIKRLINIKTCSEHTKVINTVIIYILQALINSISPGNDKGWFSSYHRNMKTLNPAIYSLRQCPLSLQLLFMCIEAAHGA